MRLAIGGALSTAGRLAGWRASWDANRRLYYRSAQGCRRGHGLCLASELPPPPPQARSLAHPVTLSPWWLHALGPGRTRRGGPRGECGSRGRAQGAGGGAKGGQRAGGPLCRRATLASELEPVSLGRAAQAVDGRLELVARELGVVHEGLLDGGQRGERHRAQRVRQLRHVAPAEELEALGRDLNRTGRTGTSVGDVGR